VLDAFSSTECSASHQHCVWAAIKQSASAKACEWRVITNLDLMGEVKGGQTSRQRYTSTSVPRFNRMLQGRLASHQCATKHQPY
jgi:hypothetical protein